MQTPTLYKYRLHELFIAQFGPYRFSAKEVFADKYKTTVATVRKDCEKTFEDSPIKPERLKQYADFFKLQVEDLKTKKQAA